MSLAKGEYISFVDSDDAINPYMYETMYNGAVQNGFPEVITTGINFIKRDKKIDQDFSHSLRRKGQLKKVEENPDILYWQSPSCGNKLFRKDTLKNLKFLENCMWEDIAFSFSAIINAENVLIFGNNDYFYRRDITSGVSSKNYKINPHLTDIFKVADELERNAKENNRYDLFAKQIQFLQISSCLQRISEINYWKIDDKTKRNLKNKMYSLITKKYGDPQKLDQAILSTKVDLNEIYNMADNSVISDEEFSSAINKEANIR